MPRFHHSFLLDHTADNAIIEKKDIRFEKEEVAIDFATTQYLTDFIPRSVIQGATGLFMILECPHRTEGTPAHPREVFYINSMPGEG
jgi:hypothetical protein